MIGYVTIGTRDLMRAAKFFDVLLAELGGSRFMETEKYIAWSAGPGMAGLAVTYPYDGGDVRIGNGVMVGLSALDREHVDRVYHRAIRLGAADEGVAGPRGYGFYAGYFRDLDGNKFNVHYLGS